MNVRSIYNMKSREGMFTFVTFITKCALKRAKIVNIVGENARAIHAALLGTP